MTIKETGTAAAAGDNARPIDNVFTRHLRGETVGIDVRKLNHNAMIARRQAALVSKHAVDGKALAPLHNLSRKGQTYFAPVVGREGSQPDNDRRARNRKASI